MGQLPLSEALVAVSCGVGVSGFGRDSSRPAECSLPDWAAGGLLGVTCTEAASCPDSGGGRPAAASFPWGVKPPGGPSSPSAADKHV